MTDTPIDSSVPDPTAAPDPTVTPVVSDPIVSDLADAITGTDAPTGSDNRPTDGAVLRYGTVTAVGVGADLGKAQTDTTGDYWNPVDSSYLPTVGDLVYLFQQGPVSHIGGRLGGGPSGPPVGVIHAFGGPNAPDGWLLCNGAAVSRATYPELFGVCGVTYGSGNGSTTFNLPDLTDRIPTGSGTKFLRGEVAGSELQTLTLTQLPAHTHSTDPGNHTHTTALGSHGHTATQGTHDHTGIATSHGHSGVAATHDHTGVATSHSHSGGSGSHSHTASQGTHSHGAGGGHSHTFNLEVSNNAFQAVNGGTGDYAWNNITRSTSAVADHSHGASDAGPISVGAATVTMTVGSATVTSDVNATSVTPQVSNATVTADVNASSAGAISVAAANLGTVTSSSAGGGGTTSTSTGSGASFNNMPPYLAVQYIIRATR